MKQILPAILLSSFLFVVSCKKNDNHQGGTFKGKETAIGSGAAYTTVELDQNNVPLAVGITLKPGTLTNLPEGDDIHHGYEYELELPAQKAKTPFDHAVMDWNPHGHPPEDIYDKPHFDFHFYMATRTEVDNIPEYDEAPETQCTGTCLYSLYGHGRRRITRTKMGHRKSGTDRRTDDPHLSVLRRRGYVIFVYRTVGRSIKQYKYEYQEKPLSILYFSDNPDFPFPDYKGKGFSLAAPDGTYSKG
ncbi:DUF5602 domain-containing protein [Flavitalea flava]